MPDLIQIRITPSMRTQPNTEQLSEHVLILEAKMNKLNLKVKVPRLDDKPPYLFPRDLGLFTGEQAEFIGFDIWYEQTGCDKKNLLQFLDDLICSNVSNTTLTLTSGLQQSLQMNDQKNSTYGLAAPDTTYCFSNVAPSVNLELTQPKPGTGVYTTHASPTDVSLSYYGKGPWITALKSKANTFDPKSNRLFGPWIADASSRTNRLENHSYVRFRSHAEIGSKSIQLSSTAKRQAYIITGKNYSAGTIPDYTSLELKKLLGEAGFGVTYRQDCNISHLEATMKSLNLNPGDEFILYIHGHGSQPIKGNKGNTGRSLRSIYMPDGSKVTEHQLTVIANYFKNEGVHFSLVSDTCYGGIDLVELILEQHINDRSTPAIQAISKVGDNLVSLHEQISSAGAIPTNQSVLTHIEKMTEFIENSTTDIPLLLKLKMLNSLTYLRNEFQPYLNARRAQYNSGDEADGPTDALRGQIADTLLDLFNGFSEGANLVGW